MRKFMLPLTAALDQIEVEEGGFQAVVQDVKLGREGGGKVYFVGNGGSAAIASHMAIDWLNKGKFDARCLNDPAALTCLANDYGYEDVFARQLKDVVVSNDTLFAISSSGQSPNILRAVEAAKCYIVTLSGFAADNPLRQRGTRNFYVPSKNYGVVETAHLAILHALLEAVSE